MLGKKFIFSHINKDVKAAALRQALDLLTKARVCTQVFATHANGLPLISEANNKTFKVNFLDIGLVASQLGLGLHQLKNTADLNLINNGAIAEQMVGQQLLTIEPFYIDPSLCYWAREERSSNAEIDYVIQNANQILPVEVKAGHSGSMRSLHLFMQQKQLDLAIRINTAHPVLEKVETNTHQGAVNYHLLSIPMYMIGQLKRLLQSI
jgi:predicted AAA+ superfamily ATPase